MICGPPGTCPCAFESSTLNISIGPEGQIILEQAEFTDIAALQAAVDALEAWQTTATTDISDLETASAAYAAAIVRFEAMAGGTVLQSGAGVGPTVGATALQIVTASLGPFGVAGTLVWGGHAVYAKTVGTDTFSGYVRLNGTDRARGADRAQLTAGWTSAATAVAVAAADTPVISYAIQRDAGTGTATTVASTNAGGLWWHFSPN